MLKISLEKNSRSTVLRVEGRLAGPWADELQRAWQAVSMDPAEGRVAVDLTDVTFVDDRGKRVLETLYAEGAKLKASGCVTRQLVEEIVQTFNRTHSKQIVTHPQ
jgi:anti-anti-sigma regulatory factor